MQSSVVRMARPEHQEDGMVPRRGRKVTAPRQADADAMENHRAHYWTHGSSVLRKIRIFTVSNFFVSLVVMSL